MMNGKHIQKAVTVLLGSLCLASTLGLSHAESLFQAGISYQTAQPFTPRSLFAIPRPHSIGDMVTITINENSQVNIQNNNTITRKQELEQNNTNIFNRIIKHITGTSKNILPSVNGLSNSHDLQLQARGQKQYQYTDAVTCQVVQVLPNGYLAIQGRKTIGANQENQDLMVSGIVNPYFLDNKNAIPSGQVANLQMQVVGKGVMSRQQGDGILGKYWQFVN